MHAALNWRLIAVFTACRLLVGDALLSLRLGRGGVSAEEEAQDRHQAAWLASFGAERKAATAASVSENTRRVLTEAEDSCANEDCSWTQQWSCPGWSSGSKGIAYDDNSKGFQCCCGSTLLHAGEDCWNPCNQRGGKCDWCGRGNVCCSRRSTEGECKGTEYFLLGDGRINECVAPPAPEATAEPAASFVYLVVMSRAGDQARRQVLRGSWYPVAGVSSRFAVCARGGGDEALRSESRTHEDLLILDCDEGYFGGALTRKVIESMRTFLEDESKPSVYMKIDDDTFVAWKRMLPFLKRRAHRNAYVGVPIDIGKPCRNKTMRWYEPFETYPEAAFPTAMSGGAGYALGRTLVEHIMNEGIADKKVLYNEDRAVGLWVQTAERNGVPSERVALKGVDGYWRWDWRHPTKNWQTWGSYPHLVHHGLEASTIACLAHVDNANEASKPVDSCFASEEGKFYEQLTCYKEK